jgi:hypothetical protein
MSLSPLSHTTTPVSHHRLHPGFLDCIQEDEQLFQQQQQQHRNHQDEEEKQFDEVSATSSHRSAVSFDNSVTVHLIPKHDQYSSQIRHSIWMDPQEMEATVARNALEFAAENWDWRRATEEKDMVLMEDPRSKTGEPMIVHPVHFMMMRPQCNMQRQFLMIMSAQQRQF